MLKAFDLLILSRPDLTTLASPPHSQTTRVPPLPPLALPDLIALSHRLPPAPEPEPIRHAQTLLSALAPASISEPLRAAFGDQERRRLLGADLAAEYAALGLNRKKKFALSDLLALVSDPSAERDAWVRGDVEALAPLLAFVGRRLDAEVEVDGRAFVDLGKRRPSRLRASWDAAAQRLSLALTA